LIRIDYDISDDSYYLFTCAELKTREVEFLEENRIEMMLRCLEKVILSEYKVAVNFLGDSLKPGHQAAGDLLFLEENLHNLKVVIKSIIMDMDLERLFIPILHSYDGLKNAAMTGNYKEVEPSVSGLLQFAVELMGREKNYRLMELELEKFYLGRVLNSIGTLNSRLY